MKVLFTANIPSPYRIEFFNELSKYCELTVLFERNDAKDRNNEWLGNREITFEMKYLKGIKVGNETAFCPGILKYLKKKEYDIIVIGGYSTPTGMYAIQYLKNHKVNFILNCDGGIIKDDSKIKYKIKKHFISSATKWISSGNKASEYLEHYGAKKSDIYEYPFTSIREKDIIDRKLSTTEKEKLKEELEIEEKSIVLAVGQFVPRKGFDVLIKSSQYMQKEIGIYIIGGKTTEEYVNLKLSLHAENIHFLDFKQKTEIEKYYKVADIFVLPTREDIWGLVINEAMGYGLPVITTNQCVAGLELIENEKNGYIVPVNNEKELAEKITKIMDNPSNTEKMAENNIRKIKKYTIEAMAKKHKDIFDQILKKENLV